MQDGPSKNGEIFKKLFLYILIFAKKPIYNQKEIRISKLVLEEEINFLKRRSFRIIEYVLWH